MTWTLLIAKPAARGLRDVPLADLEHINAAFEAMRSDPYSGDIKFLRGTNRTLRRRVGAWRILYEVNSDHRLVISDHRLVIILGVIRRNSSTY